MDNRPINTDMIFEKYGRHIYTMAYRIVRNYEDAEDVVQEVLIRWLRHPEYGVKPKEEQIRLLNKTVVSTAIDSYRRGKRHDLESIDLPHFAVDSNGRSILDTLPDKAKPTPCDLAIATDIASRIRAEIRKMPPEQGRAIYLRFIDDLTFEEVAAELRRPLSTVNSWIREARRKFSRLWAKTHRDDLHPAEKQ